jgi:uncharacterized protein with von Willebrand factor type A (vWA) domain
MQQQNWRRSVTMYVSEAEYQIMRKAKTLDISASKFTKQAVTTYIKHLEKHLEMLNLLQRRACKYYFHSF